MKVLKFGGTSVGSPERMHNVATLVTRDSEKKIVVLSAVSGTTNSLVAIGEALFASENEEAKKHIEELYQSYQVFPENLVTEEAYKTEIKSIIDEHFKFIRSLVGSFFNNRLNNELLAQGELMSTKMFTVYLKEQGAKAHLLPALDYMLINEDKEPVIEFTTERLQPILDENDDVQVFVTQGFICRNHEGEIDNLQRGGSDYSASLIAAGINAEECQIWTDIDGMHNNDPRFVENTFPVAELSFHEASELAYFGAKILHPTSIIPAQKYNIPVRLKNTLDPDADGTYISETEYSCGIKSIAAKDGITAIKIKSSRMVMAYGFLRKVFEVFEKHRTPIDMITTSEVAVSLTIDDDSQLTEIVRELAVYGKVQVDQGQTIICAVGNFKGRYQAVAARIVDSLKDYPIRMISYGGSDYNVSVLIDTNYKQKALKTLNEALFLNPEY
ncbi:aspartokinase [Fulvitalea axinellae]|uniref:Aspartokinase n=1 Tax=Fulvitalea axinellae TaxID=1182444 RepID=A0AAU9CLF8_9BACT|nr:aspartokinase [Fulvitalea axinellae]